MTLNDLETDGIVSGAKRSIIPVIFMILWWLETEKLNVIHYLWLGNTVIRSPLLRIYIFAISEKWRQFSAWHPGLFPSQGHIEGFQTGCPNIIEMDMNSPPEPVLSVVHFLFITEYLNMLVNVSWNNRFKKAYYVHICWWKMLDYNSNRPFTAKFY